MQSSQVSRLIYTESDVNLILFRSYAWDTSTPGGKCNDPTILEDVYYATTAVNIVTDWFCALLPVPLLWSVQLNRNAKLSVACLLSLGIFASLSACIRLHYTVAIGNTEKDYLFGVADVVIWGCTYSFFAYQREKKKNTKMLTKCVQMPRTVLV